MSEYISGSESAFVEAMNKRAAGLNMTNTNFVNCCGLDVARHQSTARDIALMSLELTTQYPEIYNYTTTWMDTITHTTSRGTSEFGLTNTNKLVKQYPYATGLKTGSTSGAKYCLSATAAKDNVNLIAVVMAAPDYKVRFSDAITLLNYGFSKCQLYTDKNNDNLTPVIIHNGIKDTVKIKYSSPFHYLDTNNSNLSEITKDIKINEIHKAPISKNDVAGKAVYYLNGKEIGSVNIQYAESIKKAAFSNYIFKVLKNLCI